MLIGEKIILRPLKIEDLEKTHQWRNNLELIKLTQGIRFPKTLEMDKEWFENALNDKTNRNVYFGIDEIETGDFIGLIHLTNIDFISGTAIWGFIIGDKNKKGKGYGNEFFKLVLDFVFRQLNLNKVVSYIVEYNSASLKLFSNSHFIKEGVLKNHFFIDGKYNDVVIMSLFKEEYLRNNG